MGLLDAFKRAPRLRVHLLLKGHIGTGWYDVDRVIALEQGATLKDLIARAEHEGIGIRGAIEASPHLRHTLMINGERCPVAQNQDRAMADGDEVFLLAPLAGG